MFPLEKVMNASEKRILKLAIILFTIGLVFRYLPWGLPSIESFEVGDAVVVANASPPVVADSAVDTVLNKVNDAAQLVPMGQSDDSTSFEHRGYHRKPKKVVSLPLHINTASAEDLAFNSLSSRSFFISSCNFFELVFSFSSCSFNSAICPSKSALSYCNCLQFLMKIITSA